MSRLTLRLVRRFAIVSLVYALLYLIFGAGGPRRPNMAVRPIRIGFNSEIISRAIRAYHGQHQGKLPERLSMLTPDYIPFEKAECYFDSEKQYRWFKGLGTRALAYGIDREGTFVYLGEAGLKRGIVMYPRREASDRKFLIEVAGGRVTVVTEGLYIKMFDFEDLKARLSK